MGAKPLHVFIFITLDYTFIKYSMHVCAIYHSGDNALPSLFLDDAHSLLGMNIITCLGTCL